MQEKQTATTTGERRQGKKENESDKVDTKDKQRNSNDDNNAIK